MLGHSILQTAFLVLTNAQSHIANARIYFYVKCLGFIHILSAL